jgi:hypothetical protein
MSLRRAVLAVICLGAFLLYVHFARRWNLGFDESWHLFASTVDPFRQSLVELRREAHPPLHYLALRALGRPVDSLVWPRLASILPAVASVALVAGVLRTLGVHAAIALLAAFAFAVAPAVVSIAVCIRAYSLATAFTLAFLWCGVRLVRRGAPFAARAGFVFFGWLAIASEYSAAFVVAVAGGALVLLAPSEAGARRGTALRRHLPELAALGAGGLALAAYRRWTEVEAYGHLADLFRQPGESALAFAARGVTASLGSLFAPLSPRPDAVTVLAVVGAFVALGALLVRYARPRSPRHDPARAAVLAIHLGLWALLLAAALANLYPLGGRMRHQFVLFPFLVLSAGIVLDEAARALGSPAARTALVAAIAAFVTQASGSVLATHRPLEEFPHAPSWQADVATLRSALQPGDAVYGGTYEQVGLFGNLRTCRWTHAGRSADRHDEFDVTCDDLRVPVVRDDDFWTVPLPPGRELLTRVGAVARRRGDGALWVVALRPHPSDRDAAVGPSAERALAASCRAQGLVVTSYVVTPSGVAFRVTTG